MCLMANRPGGDDQVVEKYTAVHGMRSLINVSKFSTLIVRQINSIPHIFNLYLNIIPPTTFKLSIVSSVHVKSPKQITR